VLQGVALGAGADLGKAFIKLLAPALAVAVFAVALLYAGYRIGKAEQQVDEA